VPRTTSRQQHPRVLTQAAIERATSTPPPSKPLLNAHRTRRDAPPETRFARTAVYSMALYAMPPHIDKTVRHDVNCFLLGLQKEGQSPSRKGDDGQHSLARFPPSPQYWHLPQSVPLGPGGPASSLASLVAPSASNTVHRNIVPRAHPC
jgi:hypothetical protein